jgi:hypothetical protein
MLAISEESSEAASFQTLRFCIKASGATKSVLLSQ